MPSDFNWTYGEDINPSFQPERTTRSDYGTFDAFLQAVEGRPRPSSTKKCYMCNKKKKELKMIKLGGAGDYLLCRSCLFLYEHAHREGKIDFSIIDNLIRLLKRGRNL